MADRPDHMHPHDHDRAYSHDHDHDHDQPREHKHSHGHSHTHTETKAVLNRLSRAIGHLESVRRMVEDGRDCADVLMQLAAVRSALSNTAKIILKDHIEHCLVEAVRDNDRESIDELNKAIEQFLK